MKKKILLSAFILLSLTICSYAEQITTVGVIDMWKVFQAFYRESASMRELEKLKDSITAEVNLKNDEIRQLTERKLMAQNNGDEETALKLDKEIFDKTQFLQEYVKIKNAQLQAKRSTMVESSSFISEVLRAIEQVSINEGYSIILQADDKSLLWYSKAVDITDKVIERLRQAS